MAKAEKMFTIGDVVDLLKKDYDDISISKVRFLENQGLLRPVRTKTGYRKFSKRDIDRLKLIIKLQKESFLPLKVIKERLEKGGGLASAQGDFQVSLIEDEEPATLNETISMTGFDGDQIKELEEFGVIKTKNVDGSAVVTGKTVKFLRAAKVLADYGIEPRHLRMYQTFVDKEAGLFEQILAPGLRAQNPDGKKRTSKAVDDLFRASMIIKQTLLEEALKDIIGERE